MPRKTQNKPVKKSFPLRVNAEVLEAVKQWSEDELRSVNGQIEFILREALRQRGRLNRQKQETEDE
ncbi:Arc family DNA-binding protein [Litorimonas haliclonae]|uniref:Arc family DNA-binding protein n=1 Tax=Litorimonas haliclonae TaxID=2081977 RepID=UPI0039F0B0C6